MQRGLLFVTIVNFELGIDVQSAAATLRSRPLPKFLNALFQNGANRRSSWSRNFPTRIASSVAKRSQAWLYVEPQKHSVLSSLPKPSRNGLQEADTMA